MKIGVCVSYRSASELPPETDFIEENVQRLVALSKNDGDFCKVSAEVRSCGLPVPYANSFLPGELKSVGPSADPKLVLDYAEKAMSRASACGIRRIVYGSGASRMNTDGISDGRAREQFVDLLHMLCPVAMDAGITILIEPLNRAECNFINSLADGADIVRRCDRPQVRLLADIYHMLREHEDPGQILEYGDLIEHVHIAEAESRTAPGIANDDFQPFLRALKRTGYQGDISIECRWDDFRRQVRTGVTTLRRQIDEAGFR